jgi:release factor glutamine methyltransferase
MRVPALGSTVGEAVIRGRDALIESESPSLDAQLLLAHALGVSRVHVLAHSDVRLNGAQSAAYDELIRRRQSGAPVAYILGTVEWYGTEYEVTPYVLVPRPETELVLERALALGRQRGVRVAVDVGTGSGAIATQLSINLPDVRVYGIDISVAALDVARRNADRLGLTEDTTFITNAARTHTCGEKLTAVGKSASLGVAAKRLVLLQGDLLYPLTEVPDLVVANLPYLSDSMMATLSRDVWHEPNVALYGGPSGLDLYKRLFEHIAMYASAPTIVVEIDPRQAETIQALAERLLPSHDTQIAPDYAGLPRIVSLIPAENQ